MHQLNTKEREEAWRPRPGVINTEMIHQAIKSMLKDEVPGNNIDKDEGYELHEITHLYLECLDIQCIDYLWIMPSLTVLKLTGNLIEKIENLDTLVQLVDLNLSFNKITKIENLYKLIKLRHLSLFSNLITKIENLDSLKNLKIFSIGKNNIEDKDCILQLRSLNLFSLNMAANPCTQDEEFRHFVAAYLPHIEYYEYIRITEEERETGRQIYRESLQVLERGEAESEKKDKEAEAQADMEEQHSQAFVEGLDKDQLYQAMVDSDPSGQALLLIGDEVQMLFNNFQEQIGNATMEIFNLGLQQLELREMDVKMYKQGVEDAVKKSQATQRTVIEEFLESKAEMFLRLSGLLDVITKTSEESTKKGLDEAVDKGNLLCNATKKSLLSLELTLSEQLKEVFALFERSLGDTVNSFIEAAQGYFTNMREYETTFSEQLGDQAGRFLTQLTIRNEDLSSIPPPLRLIMIDKEAVNTAVASSHDIHLQVIDSREDRLMSRARTWYQKLCQDYEQDETVRFRERISEIINFLEIQAREFQQYQVVVDDDFFIFDQIT